MPFYKWTGRSVEGGTRQGRLEAENEQAARTLLRKQNVFPLTLKETRPLFGGKLMGRAGKVREKDLVIFTRQFSTMINAGLPLIQCLDILAYQQESHHFAKVIGEVRREVEKGSTLADGMRRHPQAFSDLFVNLVAAGEAGGVLDVILNRLSSYLEKSQRLKKKVKGAMAYPAVILMVATAVVGLILVFVIPIFEKMFAESGQALPLPTQIVVGLSKLVKNNFMALLGTLVVFVFVARSLIRREGVRWALDRMVLRIPLFGSLFRKVAIAKMSRTLATMLASGVPILEAMGIASSTVGNKLVAQSIEQARTAISEGRSISEPLAKTGVFPPMVTQMIHVGETVGELEGMLAKIADFYEEDVDTTVETMTSLLEPILMVFLGGIIGILVVSMYLPIFKMAQAVVG
jgi:type IV pilus assembly protein PilC